MPPPYYLQPSPLPRPTPPVSPTGTQHPLGGDPSWPSVPMPGPDPGTTVSPFMEAWRVLGVGDAAAGGQGRLEQAKMMRRLKHAYSDVPIGNYQLWPGIGQLDPSQYPPGYDPNVPATTVGQITNPLGQAGKLSTPVLTAYEQARLMENVQRGYSNLNLPNIRLPGGFGTIRPGGMGPPPPGSPSATPPPAFGVTPGMPQQGYPPPPPWSPGQPDPSLPGPPTQWPTWLQPPLPQPGDLPPP